MVRAASDSDKVVGSILDCVEVFIFSLSLRGLPPASPASSHSPRTSI